MPTFETTREIPATPSDVFAAFEVPARLAKWWGPDGFRNSFDVCEFRPGGAWRFTMHGPDGSNHRNESVFEVVERDRQVVILHVSPPRFRLTVTLSPTAAGTRVDWSQAFDDPQVADAVRHIVVPANEQNLDRLAAEVQAGKAAPSPAVSFTGPQYYHDYIGPVWFEHYAGELARRLPERPAGDVLEIACGTGLVTRHLRERAPSSSLLVATDLSKPMLDFARGQLAGVAGIDWREADALHLPFGDARFGAVVCGFGFMFVPDKAAALREARRVLVDQGLLLFTVWDKIEENPHALANAEVIESLFPGDAEMKFRTPYEMSDPALLRRLLADAGFDQVRIETRRFDIVDADPQRIAIGQIRGTPRAALIESRGIPLAQVIGQAADLLARRGGNPYQGHAQAFVVEARAAA
jgi:ubiquinone/menaquinone biosynthesis C-methylase UbiE/uncharacterized protein YndB with AHSA1/START domain